MQVCIILYKIIIDNECDDSFDENYHIIIIIVGPVIHYSEPSSLAMCLERKAEMTSKLMFLKL
jgi:hypothetical protein